MRCFALALLLALQAAALCEDSPGLKLYRRLGLPFPPKGAELVVIADGNEDEEGSSVLAWRYPVKGSYHYLTGGSLETQEELAKRNIPTKPISEEQAVALSISPIASVFYHPFEADVNLAMAMQLEAAGMKRLSAKLLKTEDYFGGTYQLGEKPSVEQRVYLYAFLDTMAAFLKPNTDRRQLTARLEELASHLPKREHGMVELYLKGQRAAIKLSRAAAGSVDALIDEWVNASAPAEWYRIDIEKGELDKVLALGLAAVPALISHLKDERATLMHQARLDNGLPHFVSVGTICSTLISQLMTSRFVNRGTLYPDDDPKAWWEKVKTQDEREYLESVVFPNGKQEGSLLGSLPLNEVPLRILTLKYPGSIAGLYKKCLSVPKASSYPLAKAVIDSKLSEQEKLSLFVLGAASEDAEHRSVAIRQISKISPKATASVLTSAFGKPKPFGDGHYWTSSAESLARMAGKFGDEKTMDALAQAMKSEELGYRVEAMHGLMTAGMWDADKATKKRCIDVLSRFFEDKSLYEPSKDGPSATAFNENKWSGPGALMGFQSPTSARNYAFYCVDAILDEASEVGRSWGNDEWERYQAKVRVKLEAWQGKG